VSNATLGRMPHSRRPSRSELAAAAGRTVPDLVAPDLKVLFVGINPGLWSGAVGRHFGNPANRIWATLHAAGFTDRKLRPDESEELLAAGYGITNVVDRATAGAADLSDDEVRAGAVALERKVARLRPRFVAFLGLTAYRTAFDRAKATVGRQPEPFADATVWLLPNPSGLNAHYQLPDLARLYGELRAAMTEVT
jgi:TDG/mug DNA glycosylase family protein